MKRILLIVLTAILTIAHGQNGFNISEAYFPYAKNMVNTPALPFDAELRYPGGTFSKQFRLDSSYSFFNPNAVVRDYVFSKYYGYNKKNNHTWVFLRTVTNDLTKDAKVQFVLPVLNHYVGSSKTELLNSYTQLYKITNRATLQNSVLSSQFKAITTDVLNLFTALIRNRAKIEICELGNELYYNNQQNLIEPLKIYDKEKPDYRLDALRELLMMYERLLLEIQPDLKFFMPLPEEISKGNGHPAYVTYFTRKSCMDSLNLTGVCFHPYVKSLSGTTAAAQYGQALTYWNNYFEYLRNVALPIIGNRQITLSEFSSSENNRLLQGADYDRLLYISCINSFKTIPNITSNFYHPFSNGSTMAAAIKMNGFTKAGGAILMPVGRAYLEIKGK